MLCFAERKSHNVSSAHSALRRADEDVAVDRLIATVVIGFAVPSVRLEAVDHDPSGVAIDNPVLPDAVTLVEGAGLMFQATPTMSSHRGIRWCSASLASCGPTI